MVLEATAFVELCHEILGWFGGDESSISWREYRARVTFEQRDGGVVVAEWFLWRWTGFV